VRLLGAFLALTAVASADAITVEQYNGGASLYGDYAVWGAGENASTVASFSGTGGYLSGTAGEISMGSPRLALGSLGIEQTQFVVGGQTVSSGLGYASLSPESMSSGQGYTLSLTRDLLLPLEVSLYGYSGEARALVAIGDLATIVSATTYFRASAQVSAGTGSVLLSLIRQPLKQTGLRSSVALMAATAVPVPDPIPEPSSLMLTLIGAFLVRLFFVTAGRTFTAGL
jgi:hypothetical protein